MLVLSKIEKVNMNLMNSYDSYDFILSNGKKNPSIIHLASDALGTMKLRILIPKLYKTDNPNVCRGI